MAPSDLMFARVFRGNFPMADKAEILYSTQEEIQERDRIGKLKSKLYQDRVMRAKMRTIAVNDEVYILKKGETKLKVIAKNGCQLTLQTSSGDIILRSVEHVTKVITETDIEKYHREKQSSPSLSQKGAYEENRPILVGIGILFEFLLFYILDRKEEDTNQQTGLRRSSRTITVPKRYVHTINNADVHIPASED